MNVLDTYKKIIFLRIWKKNRNDYFRFGSVFIKKSNQTGFFSKKTKTSFSSVILEQKPVFSVCLGFSVWLDFFRFGLGFFQFGFGLVFLFQTYKTKTEPIGFFSYFFFVFSVFQFFTHTWKRSNKYARKH